MKGVKSQEPCTLEVHKLESSIKFAATTATGYARASDPLPTTPKRVPRFFPASHGTSKGPLISSLLFAWQNWPALVRDASHVQKRLSSKVRRCPADGGIQRDACTASGVPFPFVSDDRTRKRMGRPFPASRWKPRSRTLFTRSSRGRGRAGCTL